jgi:hypothetical protein
MESGGIAMSFISSFKDATIGFSGYARLARAKAGGFGYIALLLLIVMAISGWITTVQLSRSVAAAIPNVQRAPDFALDHGHVWFDGPMPYRLADTGGTTVIIDTTGKTTVDAIAKEQPGSMLLTEQTLYQVQPGGSVKVTDLRPLQPVRVDKGDLIAFLPKLPRFVPFLYVLGYLAQLGFKALDALILGCIALLYGTATGRRVTFDLGFKLGLYAMSLPIIIQWIWPTFRTISFVGFGIWWGLAVLYLIMGLRAHQATEVA